MSTFETAHNAYPGKPDRPAIRVICIDIDETLLDFEACAWQSMKQGFEDWGLPVRKEDFPSFLEVNNHLWSLIEKGQLSIDELRQIRWNLVFEKIGIHADGPAFEDVFRKYLYNSHVPVFGAKEAVEKLSHLYPLYIVSNGEHFQQINRLTLAGLMPYFQDIFTSQALGFKKPDPRYFYSCLKTLQSKYPNLKPVEILIIGDSLEADIKGGEQAGWQALRFDKNQGGWKSVLAWLIGEPGLQSDRRND